MSGLRIDVNCDLGEGYGRWRMPHDDALLGLVTTVNVAAGFHAGDPATIRRTVGEAVARGLDVGAHVALPDRGGFGRREMALSPNEIRDDCVYQIGAVQAFVRAAGGELSHVKPHGALYAMAARDLSVANAIASATVEACDAPRLLVLDDRFAGALAHHPLDFVTESFPELGYTDDGSLVLERSKANWDPDLVAGRALRMVIEGVVDTVTGGELRVAPRSLCVHSDAANADVVAARVVTGLREAGIEVVALSAGG